MADSIIYYSRPYVLSYKSKMHSALLQKLYNQAFANLIKFWKIRIW